ncbi:phytanoyl-CoA dioxygenase family protein [Flagellimonas pacifica]|uniref:Ectoine hydroxylase-related dioxygenase, phytanoyl-CoA dioxygenase (PhyH) family n=1 Tax=Flagellimonas pacifica TaxID=1247520 RepID=A0A285MRU7_9FLAO|nr:phytanoyl-CoA dioxygenase family protein [Allomuricauda parva]SNY99890.1 Ectoine hydroxylase-related dioxygenase, phytanoyl-CoA dioxygenase (PhyH) family [Allomuricauda parva]
MNLDVLYEPYVLSDKQLDFYGKNSFIKIKEVLSPKIIDYFNTVISAKVDEMNTQTLPLEKRDTYGKAFLQIFNLWTQDERIRELLFSKRLAQLASDLMKVDGVRMYHDQALFKEGGGGITPWHVDQYYWPLTTDKTITAWIPLQAVPLQMGPLEFAAGSQHIKTGRDLSIGDESETIIGKKLRLTNCPKIVEPFDVGEISFHSGWIFHRAGANSTQQTRKVMTIIYMDKDMILKKPENDGQLNDWNTWCPNVEIGNVIDSPLNPVLFDRTSDNYS